MIDFAYFCLMDHGSSYVKLDKFLLSKGRASIGQDIALEHRGVWSKWDLDLCCKPGGFRGGHPLGYLELMPTLGRLPTGWASLWAACIAIETATPLGKVLS